MINITETKSEWKDNYVFCIDGKPAEDIDIVYYYTSINEMIEEGFSLQDGESIVAMDDLPKKKKKKYIEHCRGKIHLKPLSSKG